MDMIPGDPIHQAEAIERPGRSAAARVLAIAEEAGAKRYVRALKKLEAILNTLPGGETGSGP
jgi:hypothetical protein